MSAAGLGLIRTPLPDTQALATLEALRRAPAGHCRARHWGTSVWACRNAAKARGAAYEPQQDARRVCGRRAASTPPSTGDGRPDRRQRRRRRRRGPFPWERSETVGPQAEDQHPLALGATRVRVIARGDHRETSAFFLTLGCLFPRARVERLQIQNGLIQRCMGCACRRDVRAPRPAPQEPPESAKLVQKEVRFPARSAVTPRGISIYPHGAASLGTRLHALLAVVLSKW